MPDIEMPSVADAFPVGAAPGWRIDPATPGTERFWDGAHWSEHTRPLGTQDPHLAARLAKPAHSRQGSRGLGITVQILLVLCSLGAIGLALISLSSYNALSVYKLQPNKESLDTVGNTLLLGQLAQLPMAGLWSLTAVLFLIWLGVRYSDSRVNPALLRRSTAAAVMSWFLPILSLWWPLQSLKDLWHASRPEAARLGRGAGLPYPAVFLIWWPAWLLGACVPASIFLAINRRPELLGVNWFYVAETISYGLVVVAAWSLVVIITQIEDHLVAPPDSMSEPLAF